VLIIISSTLEVLILLPVCYWFLVPWRILEPFSAHYSVIMTLLIGPKVQGPVGHLALILLHGSPSTHFIAWVIAPLPPSPKGGGGGGGGSMTLLCVL
jgi:hypothetical protein